MPKMEEFIYFYIWKLLPVPQYWNQYNQSFFNIGPIGLYYSKYRTEQRFLPPRDSILGPLAP